MHNIGFIGSGNMATSIVAGLLKAGKYQADNIWLASPDSKQLEALKEQYGINISTKNDALIGTCSQIVLAVKPQIMHAVLNDLKPNLSKHQPLLISIAAGITIKSLSRWSECEQIVRCMPNTPAMLGLGATGLYASKQVSPVQKESAETIMQAVGKTVWTDEEQQLDAITALSGSGPAYYFLFMEAMIEAAQSLGLAKHTAEAFCIQTAQGAAAMAQASNLDIKTLRQQVCSPNGTTEKAIESLQKDELEKTVLNAMQAAYTRAGELGEELDTQ